MMNTIMTDKELKDMELETIYGGQEQDKVLPYTPKYSVGNRIEKYFPTSMNYLYGIVLRVVEFRGENGWMYEVQWDMTDHRLVRREYLDTDKYVSHVK